MDVLERFLNYVKIDTQSVEGVGENPTSPGQWELAGLLLEELKDLKVKHVRMCGHGIVYAWIPGNREECLSTGFLAHLDTSPSCPGRDVKPEVVTRDGKTVVITDGTTLLGADDKAGIAEIMAMIEYYQQHPDKDHGDIFAAFTPDEECGNGIVWLDLGQFACDRAYTVDGGAAGVIQYENFYAGRFLVTVRGRSSHLGDAKGKMINSQLVAMEFYQMLPEGESPEQTEGYKGFYHLKSIKGSVDCTEMVLLIRDHDKVNFLKRKQRILEITESLNERYGPVVNTAYKDSYINMAEAGAGKQAVIGQLEECCRQAGLTPRTEPIRGGTDGAYLASKGLFVPNIGVGGYRFHSKDEYCVVEEMEQTVDILIQLAGQVRLL